MGDALALMKVKPFVLLAWLLAILSWLAGDPGFRAHDVPGSIEPLIFPGTSDNWMIEGEHSAVLFSTDGITLSAVDNTTTRMTQRLALLPVAGSQFPPALRVTGRMDRISSPDFAVEGDYRALFSLVYRNDDGIVEWGSPVRLYGQYASRYFESVVKPLAGTRWVDVMWMIRHPGSWHLHEVTFSAVKMNRHYQWVAIVLIVAWLAWIICLFKAILAVAGAAERVLFAAVLAGVALGTGLAQPFMQAAVTPIVRTAWTLLPEGAQPTVQGLLKGGHELAFAALTVLVLVLRKRLQWTVLNAVLLLLSLAVATEALQLHRYNRDGSWSDVLIDAAGIVLGVMIVALFTVCRQPVLRRRS